MERAIQLSARLPALSKNRLKLTAQQVDQLWDSLQHPPLSYLGSEFNYRKPDGSCNNILYPHLGKAGTPYARSIKPLTPQPGALPDAGLIFDAVMARRQYKKHPNNVSSVLYYVASIIIHDLFRTNRRDLNISDTSSYLDLSPLYGCNEAEQKTIRTFKDGRLKPDAFAEKRLLGFPPGVSVLLITFNRFHNYVVENLAQINEKDRFGLKFARGERRDDPEAIKRAEAKRDEHLFQTGRLVTCGLYINFILNDYLRTIVNLNRVDTTWTLDPRFDPARVWNPDGTPAGVGNQVSVEFNLVYRWHSCISDRDEKWTESFMRDVFPDVEDTSKLSLPQFIGGVMKWESQIPEDPVERTFANLQRRPDGKFEDGDLVDILCDSIEDCAGASGARNIPIAMRMIEILGIEQARSWQCATLNEFREFFGLKAYNEFEEINSDPEVADALRQLYDHPDFVELYPGITAEEAKTPMEPGVGIAPTYTISRAILSDAVTLVRGDRFYTVDYTAANLTNWGFAEVATDPNIECGCIAYKLLIKAFPNHFKYNSVYAHYPMTIPTENHKILTKLGWVNRYNFERPTPIAPRINILSYNALQRVLNEQHNFTLTWGEAHDFIFKAETMLSRDNSINAQMKEFVGGCIYGQAAWKEQVLKFYEEKTLEMLRKKSYFIGGNYMVDAIRDIGNMVHTHFAAELFSLPLKTKDNPKGIYTEQELYGVLSAMFVAIFFDIDPSKSFPLRHMAYKVTEQLIKVMTMKVKAIKSWSFLRNKFAKHQPSELKDYGVKLIERFLQSKKSPEEITRSFIIPTAGASVPNQAQVFSQVLDFYLEPQNAVHLAEIQRLARLDTVDSFDAIQRYALEGTRLAGTFGLYRKVEVDNINLNDGDKEYQLNKGDVIFMSFISASRDPVIFPDPLEIRLDRPLDAYIQYGVGPHKCLGTDINMLSMTMMLKIFAKLPGLRRAPGEQGKLKFVSRPGGFKVYLKEDWSGMWPFPTTMKVQFDELI
ncbi:putative fatty acid oxygenase PpoA [Ascobolus immersus RN42]|uniref:Putative fatty acid oxygenase PpoA n=1 Tax=Ascobolus immersus RN42 TaxID=1160509 RepID=A0A3N4HKE3_ASCIM|nr:putative fatty acid oxygenase PpoA [Ascobolus immersus RN42]